MKSISRFDHADFSNTNDHFIAFSKQRYTKEQAFEIVKQEWETNLFDIKEGFVRHRAGWDDEDDRKIVGWWLEWEEHPRSCPVWLFSLSAEWHKEIEKRNGAMYRGSGENE